ncbi:MAG: DNA mismatch repair endonuclease MutL [Bacteroidetes bacterium]|nr:DNA mismatch repair endonuclease MutL [Bacteroidota bacterium]
MPDIVHLLPENIANQIAAGEVIQRPASLVKELLENSIDAGSTEIKLIAKEAGKKLLQVIDNGCGLSDTDARMSFERHATSKISTVEDIFKIHTLGFRGEALASVAAVAEVEMKTKLKGEELGTAIRISATNIESQEPCSCPDGTSIAVKNLFFNIPARKNFLKSDPVETRHLIIEFQRVALAYPEISFSMHHNGEEVYNLPAAKLKQRIISLFGKHFNEKIISVAEATDILKVTGFVGKPQNAKKTRGEQFLFVNKRFIRDPYLNHAILNAYDELLAPKTYPSYMIFLEIQPGMIDVNVHPSKQEIKFQDERMVYAIVRAAVKKALGQFNITPSIDFEPEIGLEKIISGSNFRPGTADARQGEKSQTISSFFETEGRRKDDLLQTSNKANWEKLYENVSIEGLKQTDTQQGSDIDVKQIEKEYQELIQEETVPYLIHQQFILAHIKSGVILIDFQLAHERIVYEKFLPAFESTEKISQKKLFAQTVTCSTPDFELVNSMLPDLKKLGFDIESFDRNSFVIHAMPVDMGEGEVQGVFENLIEQYKNYNPDLKPDKQQNLAMVLAKISSTKRGRKLAPEEMNNIIDQLFACSNPYLSPSGKPTLVTLSIEDLAKLFDN